MNLLETRGPYVFGPWTVTQLVEREGADMSHTFLFPGIPLADVRQASPPGAAGRLTESGKIVSSIQLFLLRRDDLVALVELGTGNDKTRPGAPYWDSQHLPYLDTLAFLNVRPEDVAYVFLSHLHGDHVGLATSLKDGRWVPTFPRAKYVFHPAEWDYWNKLQAADPLRHPHVEDSVRPLVDAGVVQWVHGGERVAGIRIHEATGHTPGFLLFEVEESNLWFIGDLVHHPAQITRPEWPAASFDIDRSAGISRRKDYLRRFTGSGAVLFAEHLGNPFRVTASGAGTTYEPA